MLPDSIASLVSGIHNGTLNATDVTEQYLERIEQHQPRLNAFTRINTDETQRFAADIDTRRRRGEALGPLAGVPIAVKDLIDEAGIPNTYGTSGEPTIPAADATCIARLRAADAVIVGRTGLHEFAYGFSSENHWFGPVRNPWDVATSPGGSSGGSGAAVAASLAVGALGTDTGGSVRVPAALCRIIGLKVSHGRIPLTGVFPLVESVDTVGPLGRSIADVAAMYEVMNGLDMADPWSMPVTNRPSGSLPADLSLNDVRIGVPHPWVDTDLTDDVRSGWESFQTELADRGAHVVDLDLPEIDFPGLVIESLATEVASVHRERFAADPSAYGPEVRERLEATFDTSIEEYLDGLRWRARLRRSFAEAFEQCHVVATPTVAAMRKTIGVNTIDIAGTPVPYRAPLSRFTAAVNHALLPALAVPVEGHVCSVQLIGPMWSESDLLTLGAALEMAGLVSVETPPGSSPAPDTTT